MHFAPRLLWAGSATVIALSLLLGGGTVQGLRSDALIQVFGLGLIGLVGTQPMPAIARWPLAIIAAIALWMLAQLVPLPPAIWTMLPGREPIASVYAAAGLDFPWLALSLDPTATWRSLLSLIPPVAIFFAVSALGSRSRRSLTLLCLVFGLASVLLGLAQLMFGAGSGLYLYPFTNIGSSVGFFANRNHYAALLYALIPIAAAWLIALIAETRIKFLWLAVFLLLGATYLLGIGMSQSRAGLILGLLAGLSSLFLTTGQGGRARMVAVASIAVMLVLAALLVVQFGLSGILGRLDTGVAGDSRFLFARITAEAAWAFQPFGSGFGTFSAIYPMFERQQDLVDVFVNHAHNDWLEAWLEGGWIAIGVALAFIAWFAKTSFAVWRRPSAHQREIDLALSRAASIVIALVMLHSLVDYPLRTTACMAIFALACALLIEAPRSRSPGSAEGSQRD